MRAVRLGEFVFRSVTEARWATFFAVLDIAYWYEPALFVLPDGTKYAPDFVLPEKRAVLEVKNGSWSSDDERKWRQFEVGYAEVCGFAVVDGVPSRHVLRYCSDDYERLEFASFDCAEAETLFRRDAEYGLTMRDVSELHSKFARLHVVRDCEELDRVFRGAS